MVHTISNEPSQIFISYAEEDRVLAEQIASGLQAAGYRTWRYELDCPPGIRYPEAINRAIEQSLAVVLLVSSHSLGSQQVTNEVLQASAKRKTVVPVLVDMTHAKFQRRQPAWTEAIGPVMSIHIPAEGATTAMSRLLQGIKALATAPAGAEPTRAAGPLKPSEDLFTSAGESPGTNQETEPEFRYSNLFQIASFRLPYVVLIGGWESGVNEYQRGDVTSLNDSAAVYELPAEFRIGAHLEERTPGLAGEPKCRLTKYDCHILGFGATQLSFGFSKIWYSDYVLSGERLDAPLPNDPARTYRDKYAPSLDLHDFGRSSLTNICGVGVFLITRDNRILVSKHSRSVQVYADTFSYSASGTMDWKPDVHPFDEVARECREEIGHRVNLEDMRLIGFGLDTKKLYFQFSFSEHAGLSSDEILSAARHARDFHAEMEDLVAVPFELSEIVPLIKSRRWEPAAAASMLTLCVKRFGLDKVEAAIDPHFVKKRARNEMVAEWERRASRPGDLAVMSARYPAYRSSEESTKYVDAVLEFLDRDIAHQDVLEIGAGTGRITEKLVRSARKVTCLDISQNMIELNRKRLDEWASQVTYLRIFAQDYESWHHDVVISSQVMIHNVGDHEFRDLVRVMCSCSNTIFLFEHIDVGYQVSEHTRPRSRAELLAAFAGYRVEREREYRLFGDTILFLKLVR